MILTEKISISIGLFDPSVAGLFGTGANLTLQLEVQTRERQVAKDSERARSFLREIHAQLDHQHPHFAIGDDEFKQLVTPQTVLQWLDQKRRVFFGPNDHLVKSITIKTSEGVTWTLKCEADRMGPSLNARD